jgi:hypothetical protein
MNYNSAIGKTVYEINSNTSDDKIKNYWREISAQKDAVYTYYEYVQFKRGKFDCEKTEYDKSTGRITKMVFKFNGKLE